MWKFELQWSINLGLNEVETTIGLQELVICQLLSWPIIPIIVLPNCLNFLTNSHSVLNPFWCYLLAVVILSKHREWRKKCEGKMYNKYKDEKHENREQISANKACQLFWRGWKARYFFNYCLNHPTLGLDDVRRKIGSRDCWFINGFLTIAKVSSLQLLVFFRMGLYSFQSFLSKVSVFPRCKEYDGKVHDKSKGKKY